jgi:hypothetical protein
MSRVAFAAKVIRLTPSYGFSGSPAPKRTYSCGTAPDFDRTCPRTKRCYSNSLAEYTSSRGERLGHASASDSSFGNGSLTALWAGSLDLNLT